MKGIVCKTIPYQETGKIITLLTDEAGLIAVLIKKISPKNFRLQNIASVLALSEFHLEKKKSELYHFQDATLLDAFVDLRKDLDKLLSAKKMTDLILQTQQEHEATTPLFYLLSAYLKGLKQAKFPKTYALSFLCKLLRFEGLFPLEKENFPFEIDENDWQLVRILAYATSHEILSEIEVSKELEGKLYELFPHFVQ